MEKRMQITLKAARANAGLTQQQAGAAMDVSADVISNWERGKTFPNVKQIKEIEKVYKIGYDNIIFLPE